MQNTVKRPQENMFKTVENLIQQKATMMPVDNGSVVHINKQLECLSAEQRIEWALENFPGDYIVTSSFGIQAALTLHMTTNIMPDIKVVLLDTGYLFPETYGFIDYLVDRLNLNLHVYRCDISPAWQEHRYGQLWSQGVSGLEQYNRITKVEPLQRALREINAGCWFSGLRRQQAKSRSTLPIVQIKDHTYKTHPIIDWSNRDVYRYLKKHKLPYHPLWEKGYVSLGDTHTTRPIEPGMSEENTRFYGLKRECGIHE